MIRTEVREIVDFNVFLQILFLKVKVCFKNKFLCKTSSKL